MVEPICQVLTIRSFKSLLKIDVQHSVIFHLQNGVFFLFPLSLFVGCYWTKFGMSSEEILANFVRSPLIPEQLNCQMAYYTCKFCPSSTHKRANSAMKHFVQKHLEADLEFACPEVACMGRTYSTRACLQSHLLRIHSVSMNVDKMDALMRQKGERTLLRQVLKAREERIE